MCHRGQSQKLKGQFLWSPDTRGGREGGEVVGGGVGGGWAAAKWHAVTGFKTHLSRNA